MQEQGFAMELRGAEALTLEQAREAGRMAARKQYNRDADAYDALELHVAVTNARGMAKHSALADVFCDAYDAEIERLAR